VTSSAERKGGARRGPWFKVGLLAGAALFWAVVVELGFFFLGPPIPSFALPEIRDTGGAKLAVLESVAGWLHAEALSREEFAVVAWSDFGEHERPRTVIEPSRSFTMCYDEPAHAYFDEDGCVVARINRFGFRDDEFEVPKPAGEWRAVAIGDSFTFGLGVAQDDTWPQVLERRLAETRGEPVQVVNAGFVWGHDPIRYGEWVLDDGLALEPDMVIVGMCLNDVHEAVPMVAEASAPFEPYWGGTRRTPLLHLRRALAQRELDAQQATDFDRLLEPPGKWELSRARLAELHTELEELGIPLVVAILPMMSRLGDDYPYRGLHEAVAAFCAERGIDCVDLYPRFAGRDGRALWVHPTDQHPSDVGQRLIAEGIHAHVEERVPLAEIRAADPRR
jgi:lysophospholipase L1-like esterase